MCTCNVDPGAATNLAAVMTLCARRLAELHGVDPATVIMGPVDFCTPPDLHATTPGQGEHRGDG